MATKKKPDISRMRLARGTELVPEHLNVLTTARTELRMEGSTDAKNSEVPNSTFSVNLNIPWIDSKYFFDNNEGKDPFYISFCLPPLQEHFQARADKAFTQIDVPVPVLDGLSFSFDQKGTQAATLSPWYGTNRVKVDGTNYQYQYTGGNEDSADLHTGHDHFEPNPFEGFLAYDRADGLDIKLAIYSKNQTFYDMRIDANGNFVRNFDTTTKVEDEVLSLELPPVVFQAGGNPFFIGDLNTPFDPHKTYVLAIYAPKLHDDREIGSTNEPPKIALAGTGTNHEYRLSQHLALVSVCVSMRFKMERVLRDRHGAAPNSVVQNQPTKATPKTAQTITQNMPAVLDPITADGTKGISTNIQALDKVYRDKLRGGYQDSPGPVAYPHQHLAYDAGYEVIAVPMMQGFPNNRLALMHDWHKLLYANGGVHKPASLTAIANPYIDRRIIPIPSGFTLHHVVAMLNFTSDKLISAAPAAVSNLRGPFAGYASMGGGRDQLGVSYTQATLPDGSKLSYQIGVGLVTGEGSDDFLYQQLAYVDYNYADEAAASFSSKYLIDAIGFDLAAVNNAPGTYDYPWEQLLVSVPLVRGGSTGKGYWQYHSSSPTSGVSEIGTAYQGPPIFIGEGDSRTARESGGTDYRTDIGSTADSPSDANPATEGCEQYIEVRMAVKPLQTVWTANTTAGTYSELYGDEDIAVGYGGNFVYLIGKKHLRG